MTRERVLAVVDDLMDRSRISAAIPDVQFVRGVPEALGPSVVVVDGGRASNLGLIDSLVAAGCRVVVYVPHVDTDAAEQARRVGATVLSRSRFFRDVSAGIANVDEADTDR